MSYKTIFFILAMLFTQQVFASTVHSKPDACPSLSAIAAAGVNRAEYNSMIGWVAVNMNQKYDTDQQWTFGIFTGQANDESDAIAKSKDKIKLLTMVDGPNNKDNKDEWVCFYLSDEEHGVVAIAVTPPSFAKLQTMISRFK